jgi:hypothetical protein
MLLFLRLRLSESVLSYTYRDLLAENLFNIFLFVYSSQPIRLHLLFLHVWEKWYLQSEATYRFSSRVRKTICPIRGYFMCEKMASIYWIEKSQYYNKQKTAWKVPCTFFIHSPAWRLACSFYDTSQLMNTNHMCTLSMK